MINRELLEKHEKVNQLERALERCFPGDLTPPPRGCARPLLAHLLDALEWDMQRAEGIVQLVTNGVRPCAKKHYFGLPFARDSTYPATGL